MWVCCVFFGIVSCWDLWSEWVSFIVIIIFVKSLVCVVYDILKLLGVILLKISMFNYGFGFEGKEYG